MAADTTALVVGLGTIARTHLTVLRSRGDVEVVAGVDPAASDEHPFPVHSTLPEALAAHGDVGLVVVATPTPTHAGIVDALLRDTEAVILSEKPLAPDLHGIRLLQEAHPEQELATRLRVAHHFAFSPEVEWALAWAADRADLGPPVRVRSVFNDAYAALPDHQLGSYVSSWVDSGPNQLSVVAPFVDDLRVVEHDTAPGRAVTRLEHRGGHTVLTSNWSAADTSKQTDVDFADGTWLRMDHTSMTVHVGRHDRVTEHVAYTGTAGRKEAHYLGVYRGVLDRGGDPRLGLPLAAEIARLLEDAQALPARSDLRWSSVDEGGLSGRGGPAPSAPATAGG